MFSHYFFKCFLALTVSSFCNSNHKYDGCLLLSHWTLMPCSFFSFFCLSFGIVYIAMAANLFIFPSVGSHMLLVPFNMFFITSIALFNLQMFYFCLFHVFHFSLHVHIFLYLAEQMEHVYHVYSRSFNAFIFLHFPLSHFCTSFWYFPALCAE